MTDENKTKIQTAVGPLGAESPTESPTGVPALSARLAEAERRLSMASAFSVGDGIVIAQRGAGRWAVTDGFGNVMNADRQWEWEPMPSSRTDDFIARTRFTLDDAFALLGPAMS